MNLLRPTHPGASTRQRARHKLTSVLTAAGLATIGVLAGVVSAAPARADMYCPAAHGVVTCTFISTRADQVQTWTVPDEAAGQPIQIVATGEAGWNSRYRGVGSAGGHGAVVSGSFNLAPGTELSVVVPGAWSRTAPVFLGGGWAGGVSDGTGFVYHSGAGGGMAQVAAGGRSLVIAGGGGGAGAPGHLNGVSEQYFPGGAGGDAGLLKTVASSGAPAPFVSSLSATGGAGGVGASPAGSLVGGTPGAGGVGGNLRPGLVDCTGGSLGITGRAGGTPSPGYGGGSRDSTFDGSGSPGGAGGGGWAGGGAGGQGGFGQCAALSSGGGGGGGGGASFIDSSVIAGTAASSLSTYTSDVQISYRLPGPTATLTPAKWMAGGVGAGGILDHVDIGFDRPVTGLTGSAFSLSRDGVAVSLVGTSITGSGSSFALGPLITPTIAEGHYVLTLAANSGVVDSRGTPLANDVTLSFVVDRTRPTLTFDPVSTPRQTKVDAVSYTLSEPTPGGLFDYPAYRLTRDGVAVSVPLPFNTASSDRKTFTFGNLAEVTKAQGTYVFTVPAYAIHDASGNSLAKDATLTWYTDAVPTATWDAVTTPRDTGIASATLRFTEPVTGVDLSDFRLFQDGSPVSLSGVTLTGSGAVYTLNGLLAKTSGKTTFSGYELDLRAVTGIADLTGHSFASGQAKLDFEVPVDALTASIDPVVPQVRKTPVTGFSIHFSRPVANFDIHDVQLSRDGVGVNVGAFGGTVSGSGADYTISVQSGATTTDGVYQLKVSNLTGVTAGGMVFQGPATSGFTIDSTPPVVTIRSPYDNTVVVQGDTLPFEYGCDDGAGSGVASCVGTVPTGSSLPTDKVGVHTLVVKALDQAGNTVVADVHYVVVAPPSADLGIAASGSPDGIISAGDVLTYSLRATNYGPDRATGVTLRDTLPAGATFVSASDGCTAAADPHNAAVTIVSCAVGTLDDTPADRQIVVRAAAGNALTNRVTISGEQADPDTTQQHCHCRLARDGDRRPLGRPHPAGHGRPRRQAGPDGCGDQPRPRPGDRRHSDVRDTQRRGSALRLRIGWLPRERDEHRVPGPGHRLRGHGDRRGQRRPATGGHSPAGGERGRRPVRPRADRRRPQQPVDAVDVRRAARPGAPPRHPPRAQDHPGPGRPTGAVTTGPANRLTPNRLTPNRLADPSG
jgi:uncharacterized repeat protein (TIGR01451 family)